MSGGRIVVMGAWLASLLVVAACGERPQTEAGPQKKADAPAYDGSAGDPYAAGGWKAGDKASWERHLTQRAQAQNEYVRIGSK